MGYFASMLMALCLATSLNGDKLAQITCVKDSDCFSRIGRYVCRNDECFSCARNPALPGCVDAHGRAVTASNFSFVSGEALSIYVTLVFMTIFLWIPMACCLVAGCPLNKWWKSVEALDAAKRSHAGTAPATPSVAPSANVSVEHEVGNENEV